MVIAVTLTIISAIALSACQTVKLEPLAQPLEPAAGPTPFKVGDTFSFKSLKNGKSYDFEIIATGADSYTYRSKTGKCETTRSNSIDFYANIKGENCSYGSIRRDLSNIRGSIWPLQIGKEVSFSVAITYNGTWHYGGSCEVKEQGRLTLPYGHDDVFKVICHDNIHIITSYYSPAKKAVVKYRFERPGQGLFADYELTSIKRQ